MDAAPASRLLSRRPAAPLSGRITVPGDKSISHRALMFGALAIGETRITGLLEGEDVLRTAAAMRALGAEVTHDPDGTWRVAGRGIGGLIEPADVLDMGNSGTAARLLCGILASHPTVRGDDRRRQPAPPADAPGDRSAVRLRRPLRRRARAAACRSPCRVRREALPLDYRVPVPSAQVKSAVLLCGLNAPGITRVEEPEATRDHSENMLRHFGADGAGGSATDAAASSRCTASRNSAAPMSWCRAIPRPRLSWSPRRLLVPGSRLTIPGVGLNELRCGLFATLAEMGADIDDREPPGPGRRAGRRPDRHPRSPARRRCAVGACAQHDRRIPDPGGDRRHRIRHHADARTEGAAGQGERPAVGHRGACWR